MFWISISVCIIMKGSIRTPINFRTGDREVAFACKLHLNCDLSCIPEVDHGIFNYPQLLRCFRKKKKFHLSLFTAYNLYHSIQINLFKLSFCDSLNIWMKSAWKLIYTSLCLPLIIFITAYKLTCLNCHFVIAWTYGWRVHESWFTPLFVYRL